MQPANLSRPPFSAYLIQISSGGTVHCSGISSRFACSSMFVCLIGREMLSGMRTMFSTRKQRTQHRMSFFLFCGDVTPACDATHVSRSPNPVRNISGPASSRKSSAPLRGPLHSNRQPRQDLRDLSPEVRSQRPLTPSVDPQLISPLLLRALI